MNQYLYQLEHELLEFERNHSSKDTISVLELLWDCYFQSKPTDDGRIRQAEEALAPIFDRLNFQDSNAVFDVIDDLCAAYQRAAFFEGIHIGAELAESLHKKCTP